MRSIGYRLGGRARSVDDCLHYARSASLRALIPSLGYIERISELWLLRQFVLHLQWHFDSGVVSTQSVLGGVFLHQSLRAQRVALGRANGRLEAIARRIRSALPTVQLQVGQVEESSLFMPPWGHKPFSGESHNG
jgi:hypothetical protein